MKSIVSKDHLLNPILEKYRGLVGTDSYKARELIKRLDYRENSYLLQCISQTYLDEARFKDNSNEIRKEINFRKWKMAEKYIIKAFSMQPNNAEVLYTMGKVREANFQNDIAIYCFEKLIKIGFKKISKQKYSRGEDFAKELINDAKFELYKLHCYDNPKLSEKYLKEYKAGLAKGITTIYEPLKNFLMK